MYAQERRQFSRKQVNKFAEIKFEQAEKWTRCFIRDLSMKGMELHIKQKLQRDMPVRFKLKAFLKNEFNSDIIESWVLWHRTINDINVYGMYFLALKAEDKEYIYDFVYRQPGRLNKKNELTASLADPTSIHTISLLLNRGIQKGGGGMSGGDFEDKRIFERLAVNVPVRFLDVSSNKEGVGKTEDISAKGLGFSTDEQLLPMTPLEMWVEIPGKGESLYTRGEVVWSRVSGNKYRAGINLERADLLSMSRLLRVA